MLTWVGFLFSEGQLRVWLDERLAKARPAVADWTPDDLTAPPTELIVRDTVGLAGLGATLLGRQLAWGPPITLGAVNLAFPAPGGSYQSQLINWMTLEPGTTVATVVAIVLGIGGTLTYSIFGPLRG